MGNLFQDPAVILIILGCILLVIGLATRLAIKGWSAEFGAVGRTVLAALGALILGFGIYLKVSSANGLSAGATSVSNVASPSIDQLQSSAVAASNALSSAYLKEGKITKAKQQIYNVLYLDPKSKEARAAILDLTQQDSYRAAALYLGWGKLLTEDDPDHAISFFEEYTEFVPNDPEGYYQMGYAYFRRAQQAESDKQDASGFWSKADESFKRSSDYILSNPSDTQKYNAQTYKLTLAFLEKDWGYALINQNQCKRAVNLFKSAVQHMSELNQTKGKDDSQYGLTEAQQCAGIQ
jgi:tetratricopeptide (TPR) repeat protein